MPSIIIHSGDWDRIYHGLNIASMYAFFEKEVKVFLTYWAVRTVVRGEVISGGKSEGEDVEIIKGGLQTGVIKRLEDVANIAKALGNVKITACITTLKLLGIDEKELPNWVDGVGGLAEVLSEDNVIFI